MTEALQTPATPAAAPAVAAPAPINESAALAMLNMPELAPAPKAEPAAAKPGTPIPAVADDDDPLDEKHYTDEALNTPEKRAAAQKRLFDHLQKVREMTRKSHRAHGAAEVRERKVQQRETTVQGRETRAEAIERLQNEAISDFESGDTTRFLTAVGKLTKSGDPVGFWRNAALALAKGEAFKPAEQAAIAADPELKKRLDGIEQGLAERRAHEEVQQIEQAKTRHYETAKASTDTHPHLAAFCAEHPQRAREGIAAVMLEEFQRTGRPVDITAACGIIETELSARYELSPRADGQTNGEKGTTGSVPDAGRETSKEPPKPETAIAPATVPAALASLPGSARRAETPEEERARQIRELDAFGFFG